MIGLTKLIVLLKSLCIETLIVQIELQKNKYFFSAVFFQYEFVKGLKKVENQLKF